MKIFIDSADLADIEQGYAWGVADGVTTNPSLLKQAVQKRVQAGESLDLKAYITRILEVAASTPVSLEVTEFTAEGMVAQGQKLYDLFNPVADNVYIKVPVNPAFKDEDSTHFDGIIAIEKLTAAGVPTNATLIFNPEQAFLAAKAGASFVSPFAGRIDDDLRQRAGLKFDKTGYFPAEGLVMDGELLEDDGVISGIDMVDQCVQIVETYGFDTEVLAASLRNPRQVREAALVGAHIATLPPGVIRDMLKHPQTFDGMAKFTADIVPEYVALTV